MPGEELEKIAAVCVKYDLIVLSDEIYSESPTTPRRVRLWPRCLA